MDPEEWYDISAAALEELKGSFSADELKTIERFLADGMEVVGDLEENGDDEPDDEDDENGEEEEVE